MLVFFLVPSLLIKWPAVYQILNCLNKKSKIKTNSIYNEESFDFIFLKLELVNHGNRLRCAFFMSSAPKELHYLVNALETAIKIHRIAS